MLISLGTPVRSLLLAVVLAFAAHAAEARAAAQEQPQTTTARSTARSKDDAPRAAPEGVPVDGLLIIAGIVGAVIFLAWVCSRVGDSR